MSEWLIGMISEQFCFLQTLIAIKKIPLIP